MKHDNTLRESADEFYYDVSPRSKYRELKRQVFHIALGLFIILLVIIFGRLNIAVFLTFILFTGGLLSFIHKKHQLSYVDRVLEHFDRDDDRKLFPGKGAFFYIFGCTITLFIFPRDVALAGVAVLAVGDSVSHLFGNYVKRRIRDSRTEKIIEGSILGVVVSSLVASFFVDPLFAFIGSAVAMAAEISEDSFFGLDDNFYIPFIASLVIFLLNVLIG